jgi:hypothetical protein
MISLYYWIYTKHFSRFAVMMAILAKSSADGLMFMAVSDKTSTSRHHHVCSGNNRAPCFFNELMGFTTDG